MNSEELEYTCHYCPHKVFDELGNEVEVNRKPEKMEFNMFEIRKFVRSVEIKSFKRFSEKIEEKLKKIEEKLKKIEKK